MRPRRTRLGCRLETTVLKTTYTASMRPRRTRLGCAAAGTEEDAGVLARAIVRLAMSYVSMPPEADHDVAADLARLMTPFAERYGVADIS